MYHTCCVGVDYLGGRAHWVGGRFLNGRKREFQRPDCIGLYPEEPSNTNHYYDVVSYMYILTLQHPRVPVEFLFLVSIVLSVLS
jgi:hypothetical protein